MVLNIGTKIESNTYYTAASAEYHIYPQDAKRTYNMEYMAMNVLAGPFLDVAFLLENIKNTTLDFGGAKLILHGRIAPFVLHKCENLTIKNCTVCYDRPYYTMADILEVDETHLKIHVDKEFPYRVDGRRMYVYGDNWENGLNYGDMLFKIMSPQTCEPVEGLPIILGLIGDKIFPRKNPPCEIVQLIPEKDGDNVILHGKFPKEWQGMEGNKIAMTHEKRDKNSIYAIKCKNLLVENYRIINGASMGFVGSRTEGVTLRGFNIFRDEENQDYIMNNADAIHTFYCKDYINIEDCRIESLLDDQINIHSSYGSVREVGEDYMIVAIKSSEIKPEINIIEAGDEVAVFDKDYQAIYLSGDATYWFEGTPIRDLTIKNCKFKRESCIPLTVSYGVKGKEPYHRNIKLLDNEAASELLVRADSAKGIKTSGNVNTLGKTFRAELKDCIDCEILDAEIVPGGEISGG